MGDMNIAAVYASGVSRKLDIANAMKAHGQEALAALYLDLAKNEIIQLGNELGFDVIGKEKPE